MKNVKWISNLKLRLGWGQTGNSGGATDLAVAGLSLNGTSIKVISTMPLVKEMDHLNFQTGLYAPLVDTNLKWETNEQTNIGVDFGLLNGDLNIGLDYFIRTSKDLLLNRQIRASQGKQSPFTPTMVRLVNKGFGSARL